RAAPRACGASSSSTSRRTTRAATARSWPRRRPSSQVWRCTMGSWTAEARQFLEAHRVGHLATAGADGAPHVIPVCYALDDEALYFVADEKPKRRPARELLRLRNLRANPRAALVVDDYDEDWTRLAYVLVRGPARVIEEASAPRSRADGMSPAASPRARRAPAARGERAKLAGSEGNLAALGCARLRHPGACGGGRPRPRSPPNHGTGFATWSPPEGWT